MKAEQVVDILEEMESEAWDANEHEKSEALNYAGRVVQWARGWFLTETEKPHTSGRYLACDDEGVFMVIYTAKKGEFSGKREVKAWRYLPAPLLFEEK